MKKLRIFISRNAQFRGQLNYLPNELRVLDWDKYPWHFLPSNFNGKKLIVFRMHNSLIKELGGGVFMKLTSMKFSFCNEIREIPDLSSSSNLKELIISKCPNLVEVHQSVGSLDKLVTLEFQSCSKLQSFPKSLKLRSLEKLSIYFCERLQHFPEIDCEMEKTISLYLGETGINELPSSISNLSRLKSFTLFECKTNVVSLPRSIFQFKALESLYLGDCRKLVLFGKDVGHNGQNTAPMTVSDSTREYEIPSSAPIRAFPSLEKLNIERSRISQSDLFTILFNCSDDGLEKLILEGTNIKRLPFDMVRFVQLRHLNLDGCKQLREIPELPANIEGISARGCASLERFSQLPKILWQFNESGLQALEDVDVTGCHKLLEDVCSVPETSMFQGYPTSHPGHENGGSYAIGLAFVAVFPGSTKPNSLYPCKENSGVFEIDIDALRNSDKILRGIALYVIFGPTYGKSYMDVNDDFRDGIKVHYSQSGSNFEFYRVRATTDNMRSDHVLLLYISACNIEHHNIEHAQVSNAQNLLVIKYCGFYPVYMNDEEEAAKDKSEMLHGGTDSNLEFHWERKRKYSSTSDTQISSLEDGNDDAREELDSEV